jgi:hypothetical protein
MMVFKEYSIKEIFETKNAQNSSRTFERMFHVILWIKNEANFAYLFFQNFSLLLLFNFQVKIRIANMYFNKLFFSPIFGQLIHFS